MIEKIKNNPPQGLRAQAVCVRVDGRPRRWVRWFVTPFAFKGTQGTRIAQGELDVPVQHLCAGQPRGALRSASCSTAWEPLTIGDGTFISISNVLIGPVHRQDVIQHSM
ncbi:MAG: hypothetical protein R3B47_11950 [Bacteroidia bacterium]